MFDVQALLDSIGTSELMLYIRGIGGCDVVVEGVDTVGISGDMADTNGCSVSV